MPAPPHTENTIYIIGGCQYCQVSWRKKTVSSRVDLTSKEIYEIACLKSNFGRLRSNAYRIQFGTLRNKLTIVGGAVYSTFGSCYNLITDI